MKIKYAILDQTHTIFDRFLQQYIRDTFFELMMDFGKVDVHHNVDVLLENNMDCDCLVIFGSGHLAKNPEALRQSISDFCQKDFFIAGHLLWHKNESPFLHPQMFIVNMNKYKEHDCPMFGYFDEGVMTLHKPTRSLENIHDDYTPLWLKSSGETFETKTRRFGWNIIQSALNNNEQIINLSPAIRAFKQYIYPNTNTLNFATALKKVTKDELTEIPDILNINQKNYLESLLNPGKYLKSFLFNTESLDEEIYTIPKKIFGLASGFKLFFLWADCSKTTEVVYYDYNQRSLDMWQNIVENWEGRNFQEFCNKHNYVDDFTKMPKIFGVWNLTEDWNNFRNTKPKFIRCDIVRKPEPLLDLLAPNGNFIWYSNVFKYFETIRCYGMAGAEAKEQNFINLVKSKSPDTNFSKWNSPYYNGT